jgi:hypothetical protein
MLRRWWHAVLALAIVLSGSAASARVQLSEGRSEAFRADALLRGSVASVKRAKAARGEHRTDAGSAPAIVPVTVEALKIVRAWVRVELAAPVEAPHVVAPRTAAARAPPAQA